MASTGQMVPRSFVWTAGGGRQVRFGDIEEEAHGLGTGYEENVHFFAARRAPYVMYSEDVELNDGDNLLAAQSVRNEKWCLIFVKISIGLYMGAFTIAFFDTMGVSFDQAPTPLNQPVVLFVSFYAPLTITVCYALPSGDIWLKSLATILFLLILFGIFIGLTAYAVGASGASSPFERNQFPVLLSVCTGVSHVWWWRRTRPRRRSRR